jgi:hypothetical protein
MCDDVSAFRYTFSVYEHRADWSAPWDDCLDNEVLQPTELAGGNEALN